MECHQRIELILGYLATRVLALSIPPFGAGNTCSTPGIARVRQSSSRAPSWQLTKRYHAVRIRPRGGEVGRSRLGVSFEWLPMRLRYMRPGQSRHPAGHGLLLTKESLVETRGIREARFPLHPVEKQWGILIELETVPARSSWAAGNLSLMASKDQSKTRGP